LRAESGSKTDVLIAGGPLPCTLIGAGGGTSECTLIGAGGGTDGMVTGFVGVAMEPDAMGARADPLSTLVWGLAPAELSPTACAGLTVTPGVAEDAG
jgi:hypothetical protein